MLAMIALILVLALSAGLRVIALSGSPAAAGRIPTAAEVGAEHVRGRSFSPVPPIPTSLLRSQTSATPRSVASCPGYAPAGFGAGRPDCAGTDRSKPLTSRDEYLHFYFDFYFPDSSILEIESPSVPGFPISIPA